MNCNVRIESALNEEEWVEFEARVDTSATWLTLPKGWRNKFESLPLGREVNFRRSDGLIITGEVCGPVKIMLEGFRTSFGEVNFVDLDTAEGSGVPLIGSLQLESSQALLDRKNNRLIPMKSYPLK